ncbi:MAG TPA: hypothetical protein VE826_09550 [Dongiaceae bacterium]|nr:hypothetical protein [Dongiaceae bacterium]
MRFSRSGLIAGAAVAALATLSAAPSPAPHPAPNAPAAARVTTVAGDGRAGLRDGPAAQAEFMMPSALALGPSGALYIADQSAQRIRKLDHGTVTTVAGSGAPVATGLAVDGGYRDGPAAQAQFSEPSGIAVGPDGSLYVADMMNHCIRRVRDGVVSTFAGAPTRAGTADGPLAGASFKFPRALAFDGDGNLYVADLRVGVRMIAPDGTVSTLKMSAAGGNTFFGVTAWGSGASRVVYAVDGSSIHAYRDGKDDVISAAEENDEPLPHPYAVTAVDGLDLLLTDVRAQVVRMYRHPDRPIMTSWFAPAIAGAPSELLSRAGFADGPVQDAKFFSPRGVALYRDTVYVADAGNRRIRAFPAPNVRRPVGTRLAELNPDPAHYRIAVLYSSPGFWMVTWPDSVGGIVESTLNADASRVGLRKPVRVSHIRLDGASADILSDYAKTYLGDGQVDLVVLQAHPEGAGAAAAATMVATLKATRGAVEAGGSKFVAYLVPWFDSTAPYEFIEGRETNQGEPGWFDISARSANMRTFETALKQSDLASVSAYDEFLAYERGADRQPLYGTIDYHVAPAGTRLLGRVLARYLEAARPWAVAGRPSRP